MSIVVRKENGKFNMYQNEELIHENLKVNVDKRKGNGIDDGDIRLPENSLGKKWLSTTLFENRDEVDLANLPARSHGNSDKPKVEKEVWTKYLTEEEKVIYDDLKSKCEARMTKTQKTNQFLEMMKNFTKEELMAMMGNVEA